MAASLAEENWEVVKLCLPEGWQRKAGELGALRRKRKVASEEALLRVLLIHLTTAKSLRTTAAYAREAGLCEINDAALLHRLKHSRDWLHWMCVESFRQLATILPAAATRFRVLLVDGSIVSEPGSTGTDWRLHYAFELTSFRCESFLITSHETGEGFERYAVTAGDLLMGDRGYCKRGGICHVLAQGANVLVRLHSSNLPLLDSEGHPWPLLERVRSIQEGETGDWEVWFAHPVNRSLIKGRLCVIKKSQEAAELARKKLLREVRKKDLQVKPATLELCGYVCIFTTVPGQVLRGPEVLELYRARWQVELVFKRLKGLVGLGHLPKLNPESCKAWLYGKLLVALLAERLHREAQSFSPWGYPEGTGGGSPDKTGAQPVARI